MLTHYFLLTDRYSPPPALSAPCCPLCRSPPVDLRLLPYYSPTATRPRLRICIPPARLHMEGHMQGPPPALYWCFIEYTAADEHSLQHMLLAYAFR